MSRESAVLGRLRREYVLNPITALAFYTSVDGQQHLLAGEDTDLKVYNAQTLRLCGQVPVFLAQSIHGIAVPLRDASGCENRQVLVWGGHSVKVLSEDTIENLISGRDDGPDMARDAIAETRAPDWIFDGRISPFGDGCVVLLTAHNEVIQARVEPGRGILVFGSIQSPSRPILYSGNFFWESRECVLVAAGTVFGEILVWKCHLDGVSGREHPSSQVLFVFTGHEGSIFGVHISPEFQTSAGETLRLLASCSDDRTIRVWDITEGREESRHQEQKKEYKNHISDARETGFGNNVEEAAHGSDSTRCLAVVMGHASRIWQVEFPENQLLSQTSDIVELYSFGEDATAQKWNLSLALQPPISTNPTPSIPPRKFAARLTHQSTFAYHSGKHIWSHAITSTRNDGLLIATGGADGKIALIGAGVDSFLSNAPSGRPRACIDSTSDRRKAVAWSITDVLRSCQLEGPREESSGVPAAKPRNAKEGFNRYTFISEKRLLAATNSGRVFVGTFEDDGLTWTELALPDETGQVVFSHALLGATGANPMALVGTTNGDVYYYNESGSQSLKFLTRIDGKIADIFCLKSNTSKPPVLEDGNSARNDDGNPLEFLVTILRSTRVIVIQVNPSDLTTNHIEVALEAGFMVTAAGFTGEYLVLGSRKGIAAIFKQDEVGNYSLVLTIEIHLDEAITSVLPLQSEDNRSRNYILTTCRDGKYRIHEIVASASRTDAVLLHETSPPFASSIEGAWFSNSGVDSTGKNLMLCGFRSHNFLVWNETQRHEVATVDCGGSSRSYAWTPREGYPDGFRFVFTKAGQTNVFSQALAPHKVLKAGGHGREIKAVSASPRGSYVATAAEDTVIRIWEYADDNDDGDDGAKKRLRCVAALEKHATGIQALKWHGDEYLFSSGGNEEFFIWKINKLKNNDSGHSHNFAGLAVVCEAVFPDRSEIGDARITDFDVDALHDATAAGEDTTGFRISMALSNSTVQTYAYTREAGFRLLARYTYTGACLTRIRHLGRSHILAAATDGHLAIYAAANPEEEEDSAPSPGNRETSRGDPVVVTKLHQNTVKSLDLRQLPTTTTTAVATTTDEATAAAAAAEYLVITGGDDNALGFTHISIASPANTPHAAPTPPVITVRKSIVRSAHAAAITGVTIARPSGNDGKSSALVVTASNDQRVRVWRLSSGRHRPRAQLLDERYSSVADAGDLVVLGDAGLDAGGGGKEEKKSKENKVKVAVVGVGVEVWEVNTS
ncbi:WD repeat-containing protein 6 [Parahypoxylon ruwenzoriense]